MLSPSLTSFSVSLQVRAAVPGPLSGASKQVRSYAAEAKAAPTEVSSILEQRIRGVQEEAGLAETGRVLSVGYVNTPGRLGVVKNSLPSCNLSQCTLVNRHSTKSSNGC